MQIEYSIGAEPGGPLTAPMPTVAAVPNYFSADRYSGGILEDDLFVGIDRFQLNM